MITKYSRPYPKLSFHGIQFNSPRVKSKNHFCRSTAGSCATQQTKQTTAGCITAARGPHIYPLTRTICVQKHVHYRRHSRNYQNLPPLGCHKNPVVLGLFQSLRTQTRDFAPARRHINTVKGLSRCLRKLGKKIGKI